MLSYHCVSQEYKQAKKLSKLMDKIEAVLGKDVEGKGRQKQLEREEQVRPLPRATPPARLLAARLLAT